MSRQPVLRASSSFDRRVTLRSFAPARSYGRVTGETHTDTQIWARVISATGAEQREDGSFSQPHVHLTVDTRWRAGVAPSMQLIFEGTAYNVVGVAEMGRRKGLRIAAVLATGED